MWRGKQKQPPLLKGWYVHRNNLRGDEWSLRAFANISSTAIFLRARAEIKMSFTSSEQFREYNSRAASISYIFRLQQSIWKSFSIWGFHFERTKFFEASLSDTFSSFLLFSLHLLLISIVIGGGGGGGGRGGGGWGGRGGGKTIEMMRREFKIEERK